ncbi:hypothetical protein ACLB2K_055086 [Fragaria x ananassa]
MQWTKKSDNVYVVLSNLGKLYHGTIGGPVKDIMDNVDAVEWSPKGKLIVVARKDTLNILSSNFVCVSDVTVKPASVSSVSDEEEDSTALVPVACEPAKLSPELRKEQFGNLAVDAPSGNKNIKELDRKVGLKEIVSNIIDSVADA